MNEQRTVSPKSIYPLLTIESIDPDTLERIVKETKNGAGIPPIKVVEFRGYYFIWEGNYEMLAANITGKEQIDIEVIPWHQQKNWLSEENIEKQLKAVGRNALYDFEALGGFNYSEYPAFYD